MVQQCSKIHILTQYFLLLLSLLHLAALILDLLEDSLPREETFYEDEVLVLVFKRTAVGVLEPIANINFRVA